MNKKSVKVTMVVAMLFAISLYFVGGTYARYASDFSGTATVEIAKWAVKVNENDEETELSLPFTVQSNEFVVAGQLAPDVTMTAAVEVDLKDTETAVELVVEKGSDFDSTITGLGLSAEDITLTVAQDEGNEETVTGITGQGTSSSPFIIPLQGKAAFTETNGKVKVNLTLKWVNSDLNNEKDTKVGKTNESIELPITLKVQQHIA